MYRAAPRDAAAARQLNRSVLALLRKGSGGIADAGDVDLQLVWDPETLVPRTDEMGAASVASSPPDAGDDCLTSGCRAELGALARDLRAALAADGFRLAEVRLDARGAGGGPDVVVRIATELRMARIDRIRRVADQVAAIAADADVPAAYGERVLVTHPVEHTMLTRWTSYDGFTDLPDEQAVDH